MKRISYSFKIIFYIIGGQPEEDKSTRAERSLAYCREIFLNQKRRLLSQFSTCYSVTMEGELTARKSKKGNSHRRKGGEPSEFEPEITLQLDQFFRYLTCYYPGKNKDDIINKCITGNTYWITLDSQYYPQNVAPEMAKIQQVRKKSLLKNGSFPPTKDALEEEKFILLIRRIVSTRHATLNLHDIRSTPLSLVIEYLNEALYVHEERISSEIQSLLLALQQDTAELHSQLSSLGIPQVRAARLFAYQALEKEVISQSVEKALLKEKQPRCDFCFTRDRDIVKCQSCDLYVHPLCFGRVPKNTQDFFCDQCSTGIPQDAQCELCPLLGGHFLELIDQTPMMSYHLSKGDSSLKFRVVKQRGEGWRRQFIHVSCFVLHPECSYNLAEGKVEGVHLIDRSKKNSSICLLCGNMVGLTVPCTNESCRRAYHPECAKRNNLKINVIKANNKSLLEIYCDRHKKPQCYEYLKDSVSNRVRELRKFYENLDYEIKRHGINHSLNRQKKQTKTEDNLKLDLCLKCSAENDYDQPITNCRRCYGWRHDTCSSVCPLCDV